MSHNDKYTDNQFDAIFVLLNYEVARLALLRNDLIQAKKMMNEGRLGNCNVQAEKYHQCVDRINELMRKM